MKNVLISNFGTVVLCCACFGCAALQEVSVEQDSSVVQRPLCGGYSEWRNPSEDELAVFKTATAGTEYHSLTPTSVASQVVAGTNFRFLCGEKTLVVFRPLPGRGAPVVTAVE